MRRALPILLAFLAAPASAAASSLPEVSSGVRPGPELLYAPAPAAPQLSLQAPFSVPPLLVSGTDAHRDGEYLFQDYLFDDRGADTVPLTGDRYGPGQNISSDPAGELKYPAGTTGNDADIVELRIRPTAEAIVYRLTLNAAVDPDRAVVGIGLDTDASGGAAVEWPRGAGVSSPGLDHFITAWGTGGELVSLPGGSAVPLEVSIDLESNQMTIELPRASLDPGAGTWRHVLGTGLWDGSGWERPDPDVPGVFNLGFRFDEPQTKVPGGDPGAPVHTTFPGTGNWFEDEQARVLAEGSTGDFHADVDFRRLAAGDDVSDHPPGARQARIFASGLDVPEGVRDSFPEYGGQLQPYIASIPPGYSEDDPAGLTFALHSLGGTYTQYAVYSPNQYSQFGDERGHIVVTPLSRGPDGWYTGAAEADFFEVWADVARNFTLDSERVAITGYSMGGYGTYKLALHYPDLFGRAFTTVGVPNRGGPGGNTTSLVENARWLPFMNWVEVADELVPYSGPRAQQARFDAEGVRSELWSFAPGEHFTLAILDDWGEARDFLADAAVVRDPARVNFAFLPASDRPSLVKDHAYWVSGLQDFGAGARAEIDARSLASGQGDPATRLVRRAGADTGPPSSPERFLETGSLGIKTPYFVEGTEWTGFGSLPAENALELELQNLSAATIDGARAGLSAAEPLRVTIESDGPATVRIVFLSGVETIEAGAGTQTYTLG